MCSVGRRALPALLAVIAALADGRGAHALAFDALLGAIPFAAVATLAAFGSYLERREDGAGGLQALLWTLALTMLVLSCAARSPATQMHTLPPLAASALVGALAIFVLKAVVAIAPYARLALRPAKP
jgi:hypothetical protein